MGGRAEARRELNEMGRVMVSARIARCGEGVLGNTEDTEG